MKTKFCCGTCTTNRIESKHRDIKRFVNSTSSKKTELFKVWKELEEKEINTFKDEVEMIKKKDSQNIEKCELFLYFKENIQSTL